MLYWTGEGIPLLCAYKVFYFMLNHWTSSREMWILRVFSAMNIKSKTLLFKTGNKIYWENNFRCGFSSENLFYMSLCHPSSFLVLFNSRMLVFVNPGYFLFSVFFLMYVMCLLNNCYVHSCIRPSEIAYVHTPKFYHVLGFIQPKYAGVRHL